MEGDGAITFTRNDRGNWNYLCVIYHGAEAAVYDDEGVDGFATIDEAAQDLGKSLGVPVDPRAPELVRYGKRLIIYVEP